LTPQSRRPGGVIEAIAKDPCEVIEDAREGEATLREEREKHLDKPAPAEIDRSPRYCRHCLAVVVTGRRGEAAVLRFVLLRINACVLQLAEQSCSTPGLTLQENRSLVEQFKNLAAAFAGIAIPAVWAHNLLARVELDFVGGKRSDQRIGSDSLNVSFQLSAMRRISDAIEGPRLTHLACAGQRLLCPSMG
jgi:hypothetical protein